MSLKGRPSTRRVAGTRPTYRKNIGDEDLKMNTQNGQVGVRPRLARVKVTEYGTLEKWQRMPSSRQ